MERTSKPSPAPVVGKGYTFHNCDTGRPLAAGAVSLFFLQEDGCFRSGNQYLCVDGTLQEQGQSIRILPLKNGRYHLTVEDNFLYDTDEGYAPVASLALGEKQDIAACWYMTEQGSTPPMRIMLLGDSITYGACCDDSAVEGVGCRKHLSERLGRQADSRFIFVGSIRQFNSTAEQTALYRHEGHCGWFADDVFLKNPESRGLIDRLEIWMGKYRPDVVLTQVGTNDCAFTMGKNGNGEEPWTRDGIDTLLNHYEIYLEKIWSLLPKNGALIFATVPPTVRTQCFNDWINEFNRYLPDIEARWQAKGRNVVLSQNNKAIAASTTEMGNCSDKVHLSPEGYEAMANAYYDAFVSIFPSIIGR